MDGVKRFFSLLQTARQAPYIHPKQVSCCNKSKNNPGFYVILECWATSNARLGICTAAYFLRSEIAELLGYPRLILQCSHFHWATSFGIKNMLHNDDVSLSYCTSRGIKSVAICITPFQWTTSHETKIIAINILLSPLSYLRWNQDYSHQDSAVSIELPQMKPRV
jgi:hypothetical protein